MARLQEQSYVRNKVVFLIIFLIQMIELSPLTILLVAILAFAWRITGDFLISETEGAHCYFSVFPSRAFCCSLPIKLL